jgi:hypothetical protein
MRQTSLRCQVLRSRVAIDLSFFVASVSTVVNNSHILWFNLAVIFGNPRCARTSFSRKQVTVTLAARFRSSFTIKSKGQYGGS